MVAVVVVAVVVVVVVVIVGSVRMRLRGRGGIRRDCVTSAGLTSFLLLHLMVLRLSGVGRVRRSRVGRCWH